MTMSSKHDREAAQTQFQYGRLNKTCIATTAADIPTQMGSSHEVPLPIRRAIGNQWIPRER